MEGELNSVNTTIKDIVKDIDLVRFLKNNFDVHFSNITLLPKTNKAQDFLLYIISDSEINVSNNLSELILNLVLFVLDKSSTS